MKNEYTIKTRMEMVFALGYDFLNEELSKSNHPECDNAYSLCVSISKELFKKHNEINLIQVKDYLNELDINQVPLSWLGEADTIDYWAFVLGYDLLRKEIKEKTKIKEAYNYAIKIANEFIKSKEYKDTNYSGYDALQNYIQNNYENLF